MPKPKKKKLTTAQKELILFHYRAACLARNQQWNHEAEIEKILGEERDRFMIAEMATVYHVGNIGELTWKHVRHITHDR